MSENGQFWTENAIFAIFCNFVFFAYFQALISKGNFVQNTTYYSILEMIECEQQYSGQFIAIYSTHQKLFDKNPNREKWYKNWSFSEHYFEQLEFFDWKTIGTIKNCKTF
jgi:hypothetical protein